MKLAHIELGPPDAPALVFLHGFLGRAEDWRLMMTEFADDFRCFAFDLPGHGHSPAMTAAETVAALRHSLDQLQIRSCGLSGYSLGGRLALHFALAHPEIVQFLVLESASPGIEGPNERIARREADEKWAAMLERDGLPKFLEAWYAQPLFASLHARRDLREKIKSQRGGDEHRLARVLREYSPGFIPSLWPRLPEWRAPLLFIAGELDTKFCEIGRRVAGLCPRASLHIVRGSGHIVHEEQPEEFLAALREFPMIGQPRGETSQ